MSLDKAERIQFNYDHLGSLFCSLFIGLICVFFAAPFFDEIPTDGKLKWEAFHIFLAVVFYSIFFHLFWKVNSLKKYRLNLAWILVHLISPIVTLFFSFITGDLINSRFLTDRSMFLRFYSFLIVSGVATLASISIASVFWYLGVIHRTLSENRSKTLALNLDN